MDNITIIIPIYDPTSSQEGHVRRLLSSIKTQSELPQEVILAGNHTIPYLDTILNEVGLTIPIKFARNSSKGAAENLNFLSDRVQTPLTKIMFQDDFFAETEALERMRRKMQAKKTRWVVSACNHYYEETNVTGRYFRPRFSHRIARGINSLGAPSVAMYETNSEIRFKKEMVYMFDCEWYLQLQHKIGKPSIVEDPLITIGIHSKQATHWAKNNLESEIKLTKELHPKKLFRPGCLTCVKQVTV